MHTSNHSRLERRCFFFKLQFIAKVLHLVPFLGLVILRAAGLFFFRPTPTSLLYSYFVSGCPKTLKINYKLFVWLHVDHPLSIKESERAGVSTAASKRCHPSVLPKVLKAGGSSHCAHGPKTTETPVGTNASL